MIIKEKDSIEADVAQLERISKLPYLATEKRSQAEKILKTLRAGTQGGKSPAYFIDFYFQDSPNWSVIHDFRLEHGSSAVQIDHLLINRFLDVYVLDTKHYSNGLKITERGEFLADFNGHYRSIESPIEQNKKHVKILKDLLQGEALLPKRLGFSLRPNFIPYVLVSPQCRVVRPSQESFNTAQIVRADELYQKAQDNVKQGTILDAARLISPASLQELAQKIVGYHQSLATDYYDRFSISDTEEDG